MNILRLTKGLLAGLIAACLALACGCSGETDTASSTDSASSNQSSVSSDTTSSNNTASRLTDDQIAMSQHLGNWSSKIDEINTQKEGKFTFAIQTDTHHYNQYVEYEGKNMAALSNFVDLGFIANLGDLVRGYSQDEIDNDENMRACMVDIVNRYTDRAQCPVFMTVGNHDTNIMWCEKWADHTKQIKPEEQYEMVYKPLKEHNGDKMIVDEDGSYYYMDFPDDKVRVIMLNTANGTYNGSDYSSVFMISDKQVEWFKTQALNTEYSVVVMMHTPLLYDFPDNGNAVKNSDKILSAVEEFSANGGDFVAYLSGHTHNQEVVVDDNGRLHISFIKGGESGEVVMVDTTNKVITTIGLGYYAKDREFRYN